VVENRPAAGGMVRHHSSPQAAPYGHNDSADEETSSVLHKCCTTVPYERVAIRADRPGPSDTAPLILCPDIRPQHVRELIALAKADPASSSSGTPRRSHPSSPGC